MTCREQIVELVECARRQSEPDRALRAHLSICANCSERWERERQLTVHFQALRMQTAALRTRDTQRESLQLESLMRDFARIHRRQSIPQWAWALGAAAALLVAVFIGHEAGKRSNRKVSPAAVRVHDEVVLYEASLDASALSSDDFIAVPYTPPLAPGEMVRVVHADLYPEALASMGVEVDPSWAGNLPADVVVGEDGLPRAVRITDNGQ
jgi:hypothetical protein